MHIHPIRDRISSAYLAVEGDTAMLIDAASEAITPTVLTTLADLKVHLGLIVLTHYHYDHVGAATALRQATGAPVAIHRLDADGLRRGGQLHVTPTGLRGKLLAPLVRRGERAAVTPTSNSTTPQTSLSTAAWAQPTSPPDTQRAPSASGCPTAPSWWATP